MTVVFGYMIPFDALRNSIVNSASDIHYILRRSNEITAGSDQRSWFSLSLWKPKWHAKLCRGYTLLSQQLLQLEGDCRSFCKVLKIGCGIPTPAEDIHEVLDIGRFACLYCMDEVNQAVEWTAMQMLSTTTCADLLVRTYSIIRTEHALAKFKAAARRVPESSRDASGRDWVSLVWDSAAASTTAGGSQPVALRGMKMKVEAIVCRRSRVTAGGGQDAVLLTWAAGTRALVAASARTYSDSEEFLFITSLVLTLLSGTKLVGGLKGAHV